MSGVWVTAFVARLSWLTFERVRGPATEPIPSVLPHIARRPLPLRLLFPAAQRHVGIAIIDRPYADRLRWHDEVDTVPDEPAGWHSTAVASIAAGATVGVAPEADLYFVGLGMNWSGEPFGDLFVEARRAAHTGLPLALGIRHIIEMNRRLEPGRKIRVISISIRGGAEAAIVEARKAASSFRPSIYTRLPWVPSPSPARRDPTLTHPISGRPAVGPSHGGPAATRSLARKILP